jgi:hypothetical protein
MRAVRPAAMRMDWALKALLRRDALQLSRGHKSSQSRGVNSDPNRQHQPPASCVTSAGRLPDQGTWNGGSPDSPPGGASPGRDCSRGIPTASGRALIGQELDRADMLGRIAVPPVALMVAVDRMPARAVDRWARSHRHLTSGRQPGAGTGGVIHRVAAIVFRRDSAPTNRRPIGRRRRPCHACRSTSGHVSAARVSARRLPRCSPSALNEKDRHYKDEAAELCQRRGSSSHRGLLRSQRRSPELRTGRLSAAACVWLAIPRRRGGGPAVDGR